MKKKGNKASYVKPKIKQAKIVAKFWNNRASLTNPDSLLVPGVYAASGCWIVYYCCFLANTPILLENGKTKLIENLHPGEYVVSYNSSTKKLVPQKIKQIVILNTNKKEVIDYLLINKKLKCTPKHPFWLPDKAVWINAEKLAVGDSLLASNGEKTPVETIEYFQGKTIKYDLLLEGEPHNYFADNVLVHDMTREGIK